LAGSSRKVKAGKRGVENKKAELQLRGRAGVNWGGRANLILRSGCQGGVKEELECSEVGPRRD